MSIYTFSEAELRSRFIKNIGNRDDIDVYIEVPVFCRSVDLVIQEKENRIKELEKLLSNKK